MKRTLRLEVSSVLESVCKKWYGTNRQNYRAILIFLIQFFLSDFPHRKIKRRTVKRQYIIHSMKNTEIMRIYVIYRDADVLSHTVIGISNRVLLLEYSINFKNIFHFLLCVMLTSAIHITHSLPLAKWALDGGI